MAKSHKLLFIAPYSALKKTLALFLCAAPCWVTLAGCSGLIEELEQGEWGDYDVATEAKRYKSPYGSHQKPPYNSYQKSPYSAYQKSPYSAYQKPQYSAYQRPQYSAYQRPQHSAYQRPWHSAYQRPQHSAYQRPQHSAYYDQNPQPGQEEQGKALLKLKLKPYYDILGLPYGASFPEIKKAYKKLALKYHPDRNPDKDATEAFKRINEAHSQLQDLHSGGCLPATE